MISATLLVENSGVVGSYLRDIRSRVDDSTIDPIAVAEDDTRFVCFLIIHLIMVFPAGK
jgi:hypothetical protein